MAGADRSAQPQRGLVTTTAIHRQVAEAAAGTLARAIARLPSGWAVLGDPQILPGYALLLPDPVVPDLNALAGAAREAFLRDMARLGDAVLAVTGAERVNYEILGNVEPALHAHVIPRYAWEAPERRRTPVWLHDWSGAPPFDPVRDRALAAALAGQLAAGR
jgi:diadenosine tetraphosphate (Ap4A) HIT family hydrolase